MSTSMQRNTINHCQTSVRSNGAVVKEKICECEICKKEFISVRKSACCSEKCRHIKRLNKTQSGEKGIDYIECPVCNQKVKQISVKHAKMHGFDTIESFRIHHGLEYTSCQKKREQISGENNPGYKHGGKLSKFSKKFIHGYDATWHTEQNKKHSKFRNENKELFKSNLEFWIDKYGDNNKAREQYTKFQSKNVDNFIKVYGEDEGKLRHQQKTEKWVNTMNSKSPDEIAEMNSSKVRKSSCFYSIAERELFESLKESVPEITDQLALPVDGKSINKQAYIYDMAVKAKIIEYNGDFWHSNPSLFDENHKCPYTKRSQFEIHAKDRDKKRIAEQHGYEVFVVWESDYKNDKEKVIKECINFLKQ